MNQNLPLKTIKYCKMVCLQVSVQRHVILKDSTVSSLLSSWLDVVKQPQSRLSSFLRLDI